VSEQEKFFRFARRFMTVSAVVFGVLYAFIGTTVLRGLLRRKGD